jgi:hypothetical protein
MASMDKRTTGITRRWVAAAALASPLLSQTPEAQPASELEAARAQAARNSDQLWKFRTPVLLEPSFVFRP